MTRRYTLILLSILSLSAVFNLALVWWPRADEPRVGGLLSPAPGVIAMALSGADQNASDRNAADRNKGRKESLRSVPAIIGLAQAAAFPLTPTQQISPEEIKVLGKLRSVKEKLDAKALALDARQHAIEQAEAVMKKKVAGLEAVLARVQDVLQQQQKLKNKKIKRLAAVYDSMKPAKAAPIISRMDISTTISMLAQMDTKKVGKILAFLPPEKAVRISQRLVRLNTGL